MGEREMTMVERVGAAIADAEIGYSIRLTRLVDGESTYTLTTSERGKALDFASHSEAAEYVSELKQKAQARAILNALRDPTPSMLEAAAATPGMKAVDALAMNHFARTRHDALAGASATGSPLQQAWRAMIDAALSETPTTPAKEP